MLTTRSETARIEAARLVRRESIMTTAPFLARFAHPPLDGGRDCGAADPDQDGREERRTRTSNTKITKVDRETTDDR
jgi:hypothetical protein